MTRFLLLLLFPLVASAQDFVTNGSFEAYNKQCPDDLSQLNRAVGWTSPSKGTSDFFHKCAGSRLCTVPWNFAGKAEAMDGDAYAGIGEIWDNNAQQCEFLQTQLNHPLEKGNYYCLSFYVRRAGLSSTWANGFSCLLTKEKIRIKEMEFIPQMVLDKNVFQETTVPNEKAEVWQKVHFLLQANGDETFLTIGYSRAIASDFKMTFKRSRAGDEASIYYYVDDIRLIEVSDSNGCHTEEPPAPVSRVKVDTLRSISMSEAAIGGGSVETILFDINSAELLPPSIPELQRLLDLSKKYPQLQISLSGYSDNEEKEEGNQGLSSVRAKAVSTFFATNGLDAQRIHLMAYGNQRPVFPSDTEAHKQANRRVTIILHE